MDPLGMDLLAGEEALSSHSNRPVSEKKQGLATFASRGVFL